MATTTSPTPSPERYGHAFWELLWRTAGLQFVGLFLIAWFLYGLQPGIGASNDALSSFYQGNHTRILIASSLLGLAFLNLMWFAAALRATLADAGQDGWGAAATASSSAIASLFLLLGAIMAGIAYSDPGVGTSGLEPQLNRLVWTGIVLTSFPRAMLIMAGSLGLWRAGLISNSAFAAGVACIVLTLLGGTTWLNGGFWAPDGTYSRFISPFIGMLWVLAASRVLLRTPSARSGW